MEDEMYKIVKRRYDSLVKRSETFGIEKPELSSLKKLFEIAYDNGFTCHYCGDKLLLHPPHPYKKSPSVDHRIPLTSGGTNDLSNLVLCCHQCNIIKGTLDDKVFYRLLKVLESDKELRPLLFDKWFNYGLANKIERNKMEK